MRGIDLLNLLELGVVCHKLFGASIVKHYLVENVGAHGCDRQDLTFTKGYMANTVTGHKCHLWRVALGKDGFICRLRRGGIAT